MNKVYKFIFLIILSCSVYFIYQHTKNSVTTIANIGDSLSQGINSYGITEHSYAEYYQDYLLENNQKVILNNDYSIKDSTIKNLLEQVKNNPHLKNIISESNLIILTSGYNDLVYKLSITDKINKIELERILKEIETDYNNLISEIRKYSKKQIFVIGYYNSNKKEYYLNQGIKELNKILMSNKEIDYIDTYNLLSNRDKYFSNPNSNYPNRFGYIEISNKIIAKTLEKSRNI